MAFDTQVAKPNMMFLNPAEKASVGLLGHSRSQHTLLEPITKTTDKIFNSVGSQRSLLSNDPYQVNSRLNASKESV